MAFWGVEVKPGKSYTLRFDESKGRLRITLASLGFGRALGESKLQVSIGKRKPMFPCSLLPNNLESQKLNLEFEEVEEVVFSVIGSRSIQLFGYYKASSQYHSRNKNSNVDQTQESNGNYDTESKPDVDNHVVDGQLMRQSDLPTDLPSEEGHKEKNESDTGIGHMTNQSEVKVEPEINVGDRKIPNWADETFDTDIKVEVEKIPNSADEKIDTDINVEVGKILNLADQTVASQSIDERPNKKKRNDPKNEKETHGIRSSDAMDGMEEKVRHLQNDLVIEVLKSGKPEGDVSALGKKLYVRYVGKLKTTGEVIDSSVDKKVYKFRLGSGRVIEGWELGLLGMRVREKRRLTIPPAMAYGSDGYGDIVPSDSWLVYEVELVKVSE